MRNFLEEIRINVLEINSNKNISRIVIKIMQLLLDQCSIYQYV